MKQLLLPLFLLVSVITAAQQSPYLPSIVILTTLEGNTSELDYQNAVDGLVNIGDYKNTLALYDSLSIVTGNRMNQTPLTKEEIAYFSQFKPQDARNYILSRAAHEQIIIFNEAHEQPYHRVFVESFFDTLYALGFRYFGAEGITNYKHETTAVLNETKYPVLKTGFLTDQPQYGNMVRTALKKGFHVFGYEDYHNGPEREIGQAKNIQAILDTQPDAKIMLYCGYAHAAETDMGKGKYMAGRLTDSTGINPFTIEQTVFTEHSAPEFENRYYKRIAVDYDAVLVDASGKLFTPYKDDPSSYDAVVYHPRTKWLDGRPDWVFDNGRQPYFVEVPSSLIYPCMVFAYFANEDISIAVPTDVIELQDAKEKTALALPKGEFTIVMLDITGKKEMVSIKVK